MINGVLEKLEKFFKIKSPFGVFFFLPSDGSVEEQLAQFEDDSVCLEFRRTDTNEDLDVRFFNPYDPDNFMAYTWNITTGDYNLYIEEGTPVKNASTTMESIRYVNNNALDFISRIEDEE